MVQTRSSGIIHTVNFNGWVYRGCCTVILSGSNRMTRSKYVLWNGYKRLINSKFYTIMALFFGIFLVFNSIRFNNEYDLIFFFGGLFGISTACGNIITKSWSQDHKTYL